MASELDPKMQAGIDMLARTGMTTFDLRYQDDQAPTVWMAVAIYPEGKWEVGAGHNPVIAVMRLVGAVLDGGKCVHCGRMSAFEADWAQENVLEGIICWYVYDPELKVIRRGCE